MKINKLAVSGIALAGITLASGFAASTAWAATSSYKTAPTYIDVNGTNVSNPQHVVAKDPWGGQETTWVPIYYLQQALKQMGFQTMWNGTDLTFTKYPSNWKFNVALGNPEAIPVVAPKGQMQISLVNSGPPSMNLPKMIEQDPASGVNTTYVPIYYLDTVLTHDFNMGATWNGAGNKWNLIPQSKDTSNSVITKTSYSSASAANTQINDTQGSKTYLVFGQDSQTVNLGDGITSKEDAGLGHQGYQWQEGNWTVEVLYYTGNTGAKQIAENVVSYLHTHMLPAPNTKGVIIVSSTDPNSTTFKPNTTIAWQEGTNVYELQQAGDPIKALQTVVNSNN
ncbi:hypothetical protein LLE49_07395 [Alicyclobacillus tolerans]|uniref:hypothetical protein n=1 Tax=Alicyclobacillus tolerans TaxID=90970 RepID=UPI001F362A25|nr:hypothetical protein [Alicyclobacillus tolerans]MCF8564568.1 hypothetical protein [Alicyclobacillus tolerans]